MALAHCILRGEHSATVFMAAAGERLRLLSPALPRPAPTGFRGMSERNSAPDDGGCACASYHFRTHLEGSTGADGEVLSPARAWSR